MSIKQAALAVARLYDAAQSPGEWPDALRSVSEATGTVGAAYLICDKRSGLVDWISVAGPLTEMQAEYRRHFAAKDLYAPILHTTRCGRWVRLTKAISDGDLRASAWYNDCMLRGGVDDVLGTKLFEDDDVSVLFGLHHDARSNSASVARGSRVSTFAEPLARAARLHVSFRALNRKLSAANQALHHLLAGVILTEADGRVIEINAPADRIMELNDGLLLRGGILTASRSFEATKLAMAIAATTGQANGRERDMHLLIGRRTSRHPLIVSVYPHHGEPCGGHRPTATVLVINPDWQTPSERSISELFGLSPAESRLAAALTRGKKLNEIAWDTNVEITTLRTQLSSILKKVGVDRQVDLVQTLSSIGFATSHADQ
jgi:DNA-binding CsgD family transcriptional regulator